MQGLVETIEIAQETRINTTAQTILVIKNPSSLRFLWGKD